MQRSEVQRHAEIPDSEEPSSCGRHAGRGARAWSGEPSTMEGEKHWRMVEREPRAFCQEYHRHTSPAAQLLACRGFAGSNWSQSGLLELPLKREPHW